MRGDRLRFLAALLPRVDGTPTSRARATASRTSSSASRRRGRARTDPRAAARPDRLGGRVDGARRRPAAAGRGVDERELAAVGLDVDAEPHLLVFGDGQSGKSSVLRAYAHEVMRAHPRRRSWSWSTTGGRCSARSRRSTWSTYLTSATQAQPALRDLASYLEGRIPGPDVTPDQLRNRSWWSGAEVFVLVDDYDLVATQQSFAGRGAGALLPAGPRDVGLHVVVARRSRVPLAASTSR